MTMTSTLAAIAIGTAFVSQVLVANEVSVLLTHFNNGDSGDPLLRESSIPIGREDPGEALAITVNRSKSFQTMIGFGGAMTDASAFVLMELKAKNPKHYRDTMVKLFSPTKGAGFSYMRLAIGASDYVATDAYYTCCDEQSDDLRGFNIDRDKKFVIPALKDAIGLNPEIELIASPWSAPAWMKTNGKLTGVTPAGKENGETAKLRDDCFELYADCFVKFIEAYRSEGIEVHGVTLQNEPQNDLSNYPCMRMDEADQIRLVRLLGPKLAAKNLKAKIFIHDHNWALHPNDRKVLGGDTKADPVESVAAVLSDPVAGKFIAGSAWHCYAGGTAEMARAYETIHKRFPDKQILTTELSGWGKNRGHWWGDVAWGMAHNWMGAAMHWSEASLQWNLALDHKFGPTLRPDSEAMGLVTINTDDYRSVSFEREFYAMAQMSRAARPGSKRIEARMKRGNGGGLDVIAFSQPDGATSLVVMNPDESGRTFQINDGERFFTYQLRGRSIATFTW